MIKVIKTVKDVAAFSKALVKEGVSFHPDEDFKDYVNIKSGKPIYSIKEAAFRNRLMDECFAVCRKKGIDIYALMGEIYLKETGLDKFIPLPSSDHAE